MFLTRTTIIIYTRGLLKGFTIKQKRITYYSIKFKFKLTIAIPLKILKYNRKEAEEIRKVEELLRTLR